MRALHSFINTQCKTLLEWFLPNTCILCQSQTQEKIALCDACEAELPHIKHACPQCGLPFSEMSVQPLRCAQCLKNPPPFQRTLSIYHYESALSYLITHLKFQKKLPYANLLGKLMAYHLQLYYANQSKKPEYIIPVPLHKKRLQERGFNQALEIARPISKILGIPLDVTHCKRIKNTEPQTIIPAKKRFQNLRNAFEILPFEAEYVAIIDDVMTTGHTVTELSHCLRKQGIHKIDIWCCARAHS